MLLSDYMNVFPQPALVMPIAGPNTPGAVTSRKTGTEKNLGTPVIDKVALGGVDPSGALLAKYICGEVDGRSFIYAYFNYAVAGALVKSVTFPFPGISDAPQPWLFDNWPNDSWAYAGSGGLATARNELANSMMMCGIYKEPNGILSIKFVPGATGISAKFGLAFIPYFANG